MLRVQQNIAILDTSVLVSEQCNVVALHLPVQDTFFILLREACIKKSIFYLLNRMC